MRERSSSATRSVAVPFLAGAVGGFLFAQWLNRMRTPTPYWAGGRFHPSEPSGQGRSFRQHESVAPQTMPSSHLGATEDQMNPTLARPGDSAAQSGDVSVAGTAYELDPGGITPG
jgi:hypothetical protein